jgi:glucan biosynthesis protein C
VKVEPANPATPPTRLYYLDHLRAALVTLVVIHHVALVYGAGAPFYYFEPPGYGSAAFKYLLLFVLFNQAWFMGSLFLLAGYFTPASYARKGARAYLRDRALRFGIPVLAFVFVLNPLASLGYYAMPKALTGISEPVSWAAYPHMLNMGPTWFILLLLFFDLGYAATRRIRPASPERNQSGETTPAFPGWLWIGGFILLLAGLAYAMRTLVPLGKTVLGFPTLAYLPQYLGLFLAGIFLSRHRALAAIPRSAAMSGLGIALAASALLFPLALTGRWFNHNLTPTMAYAFGHGHWRSFIYALWDSTLAVGLCLALIPAFQAGWNRNSKPGRFLARGSYAVYIIHIPVIVLIAVLMKPVDLAPFLKFGVVSVLSILASFALAAPLRRIPLLSRIL